MDPAAVGAAPPVVRNPRDSSFTAEELEGLVAEYSTYATFEEAIATHQEDMANEGIAISWNQFQALANALLVHFEEYRAIAESLTHITRAAFLSFVRRRLGLSGRAPTEAELRAEFPSPERRDRVEPVPDGNTVRPSEVWEREGEARRAAPRLSRSRSEELIRQLRSADHSPRSVGTQQSADPRTYM